MDTTAILVYSGIALSLGLVIWLGLRGARKRTEGLQAIATSLAATFRPKATAEDMALLDQSHLRSHSHDPEMTNVMETARTGDLGITLLDYTYRTGFGKEAQVWNQTVLRMQSPMLHLPQFLLYPESIFSKIAQAFGYSDIDFPAFPKFSKMYMVRGADEATVRRVFTPAVIQFCEQHRGISLEAGGDRLLFFRLAKRVKPEAITTFLDDGKRMMALFFEATQTAVA